MNKSCKMHFSARISIATLLSIGNILAYADGIDFSQEGSSGVNDENIAEETPDLVFDCRPRLGNKYRYEKSRVEDLVPDFPESPNPGYKVYPHRFWNNEDFVWPLNGIACDNAGESKLEIPAGNGPTYSWDWKRYSNSARTSPDGPRKGHNQPQPTPGPVRIVYVYNAGGNNLLCGMIIHKEGDRRKFDDCPLIEDH